MRTLLDLRPMFGDLDFNGRDIEDLPCFVIDRLVFFEGVSTFLAGLNGIICNVFWIRDGMECVSIMPFLSAGFPLAAFLLFSLPLSFSRLCFGVPDNDGR